MSLAVAVGAKSVSSRPIAVSDALEEQAEDGSRLLPVLVLGNPTDDVGDDPVPRVYATACLSSDQELQAIVTVSHYDMVWEGTQVQDCTVASVRVQVLPAFEALSSRYRETLHRIKLPVKDPTLTASKLSLPEARLVAVFSADKLKLACLIPYPHSPDSVVVVFQLRRPRSESSLQPSPPLPSYVHLPSQRDSVAPVATNPKIVPQTLEAQVSDLEDVAYRRSSGISASAVRAPSILLAGCCDGKVLAISYRPLVVAGSFFDLPWRGEVADEGNRNGDNGLTPAAIHQLRHGLDSHHLVVQESTGILAVIRSDESLMLYRTRMTAISGSAVGSGIDVVQGQSPTGSSSDVMNEHSDRSSASHANFALGSTAAPHSLCLAMKPLVALPGQFCCAEWLSSSNLALMSTERDGLVNHKVRVSVWRLSNEADLSLLSRWEMTGHRLLECGHHSSYKVDEDVSEAHSLQYLTSTASMQYDKHSDCLAISAHVSDTSGLSGAGRSFVCVWGWRQNYEGLLLTQTKPSLKVAPSFLMFAKSPNGRSRLIHTLAVRDVHGPRVRKDSYGFEVLSRDAEVRDGSRGRPMRESNLVVGSSTVTYPVVEITSSAGEFEIEWRDARIPLEYSLAYGAVRFAAAGGRNCQSVAVAASFGFCTLDCGRSFVPRDDDNHCNSHSRPKPEVFSMRRKPRWHRFGSASQEGLFRVTSMLWWEGLPQSSDEVVSSDLLVALIEVNDVRAAGRYLACWTQQDLDFDHQLLHSDSDAALVAGNLHVDEIPRYGVKLPQEFSPSTLDLFVQPSYCHPSPHHYRRKAVLLVSGESKAFVVYELQVARWRPRRAVSYKDMVPFVVLSRRASSFVRVQDNSSVFLASASFSFDLENNHKQPDEGEYVATLGVLRCASGVVEALALSREGMIASAQILGPQERRSNAELVRYWMADVTQDRHSCTSVVWLMEMSNGSLHAWSVPILDTNFNETELINENAILGSASTAKETSFWMQQHDSGPKRVVYLSTIPSARFGSVLGTEQVCRKMHRSLGEAFEKHLFRCDFLEHETMTAGDLMVSIPRSSPSLYTQLSASGESREQMSAFYRQLNWHTTRSLYRDQFLVTLQLMLLRAVESRARSDQDEGVLENLVRSLEYILSPLQFAVLVLDVGRQMEPGLVKYLFPLCRSGKPSATIVALFQEALESGSITVSASALPLFDDHNALRFSSVRILKKCLIAALAASKDTGCVGFESFLEERLLLRDIFHYTLKLDESGGDGNESLASDADESSSDDSSTSSEVQDYSLICGVSRLFRRRPLSSPHLVNGNGLPLQTSERGPIGSGYRVVSNMIVREIFQEPSVSSWKRSFALASLLLGESTNGMDLCDAELFLRHLQQTRFASFSAYKHAAEHSNGGSNALLERLAHDCRAALKSSESSVLLDLMLLLLRSPWSSHKNSGEAMPGLLLIAIVTGNYCERTREFLSVASLQHPLLEEFLVSVSAPALMNP